MIGAKERSLVIERAKHRCEYCHSWRKFSSHSFEIDHIYPLSRGGNSNLTNLAYACAGCNKHKYNKISAFDPANGKEIELYNPRKHNWADHFGWNNDYSLLIGITSIGRVTIETLKLNREGIVNMRKLLRSAGLHPPDDL